MPPPDIYLPSRASKRNTWTRRRWQQQRKKVLPAGWIPQVARAAQVVWSRVRHESRHATHGRHIARGEENADDILRRELSSACCTRHTLRAARLGWLLERGAVPVVSFVWKLVRLGIDPPSSATSFLQAAASISSSFSLSPWAVCCSSRWPRPRNCHLLSPTAAESQKRLSDSEKVGKHGNIFSSAKCGPAATVGGLLIVIAGWSA